MASATACAVVFLLDGQRFALPIDVVERITRAAEPTPLPNAPPIVRGVIDLAGDLLPVLSLRSRFGFADRPLRPSDALLFVRTSVRRIALIVDDVCGTVETGTPDRIQAGPLQAEIRHVPGALRLDDGLVLIHDIEALLSAADERQIAEALERWTHDRE